MEQKRIFIEIIHVIHCVIYSTGFLWRSRKRQMDFVRVRKMRFTDYIIFIVKGAKGGLQDGIDAFLDSQHRSEECYSKQAFSKGRERIKPEAFLELFQTTVWKFYEAASTEKWRGYHLLGIDGTRLNLPCTQKLREIYGEQTSQGTPQVQALASCTYDLLNGMLVDLRIGCCRSNERDHAESMIRSFDGQMVSNPIFIMDRGYPSAKLIQSIEDGGYKYIMRGTKEFVSRMKLPSNDNHLCYQFSKLKHPLDIRVVIIPRNNGEDEYLITNLCDNDVSLSDLHELYHMRWGIETKYDDIKNKLQVENFSGCTPDAVLQDFYASMFLANLAGALEFDYRDEAEAAHCKPQNKYSYQINRNTLISQLKRYVIELLITNSKIKKYRLLYKIEHRLIKSVCPKRPNRSTPREIKHKSLKFPQNKKSP